MTLYADDLAKSQSFYGQLLGWKQVPAASVQSGIRFYANHEQYVELISPPVKGLANRFCAAGFSTTDAESLRRFLAAHGVTVPAAVEVEKDGSKSFQVSDPEGNKIEFTQSGVHAPDAPKRDAMPVSGHIIHVGFVVHDRALLDHFYKDLLGFHLYWQGGSPPTRTDWVMMQVPDGTDWLEYMLYLPVAPSRAQLGSANHFSPGVVSVKDLAARLKQRGWTPVPNEGQPLLGVDAKWQLTLHDPDGTRAELMEFAPVKDPCCAPFTGPQPSPPTSW
jgi:catechol 2,3-dioxygenase-like lactoylglutathione lyase family enzyme